MSRWTAYAELGDTLVPLFVGGLSWLGHGYRGAFVSLGVVTAAQALIYLRATSARVAQREADDDEHAPFAASLRALATRPRLFLFLFTSSLCCLLDEVVVALAALRFRLDQGQSLTVITAGSTLFAAGGILGAVVTDRLLPHTSMRRVLSSSSLLCVLSLICLSLTASLPASLLLLAVIGFSAAPHHALIQAAAYEELPGKPGLVNAALQVFVVIEITAPLTIGVVAAEASLSAALLALSVQPLAVAWVARAADRRPRDG
jgi:predicted MFS family arabinose efflux permease